MLFFPAPTDIDKPLLAVCVKLEEHKYKPIRLNTDTASCADILYR